MGNCLWYTIEVAQRANFMKNISKKFFLSLMILGFTSVSVVSVEAAVERDEFPLYMKYKFEKMTGRKWYDASYERKLKFVEQLRWRQKQDQIKKKKQYQRKKAEQHRIQMRKEAKKRKKELRALKLKNRREKDRRKVRLRKEKAQRAKEKMFAKIRQAREKSNRARQR